METADQIIKNKNGKIFRRSLTTPDYIFFTDDSNGIMMFFINDLKGNHLELMEQK